VDTRTTRKWGPLDTANAVAFLSYSSSVTVTPICLVILAREFQFSLTQAGLLEVMRSVLLVVLLLASAFLAGRWGKVRCLGVGAILIGAGMILYAAAPGYWFLAMALTLVGIGGGLKEALINPLIQELHPNNSGKYLNTLNGFWSIGVLMTMLIGGDLLTRGLSWRIIVASLGLLSLTSGALYLLNRRESGSHVVRPAGVVLRDKIAILRNGHFWLFWMMMFFAGGIEGAYTFWSASYFQLELGTLPRAGGIGTACFAAGMIAGRFASGYWIRQHQLSHLLLVSAGLGLFTSLIIPMLDSVGLLFAVMVLMGLSVACFWPTIQSYSVDRLPFDPTALFILLSCGGIPGFAVVSWLVGWVGDNHGLRAALLVLPGVFVLLIACFLAERGLQARKRIA
jgi:fucose permease